MITMTKARQELAEMRNRAEQQGNRFKSHAATMDAFYRQMEGPSPEMQRTGQRHTLSDYY